MKGLDRTAGKIRLPDLGERESVCEGERESERERESVMRKAGSSKRQGDQSWNDLRPEMIERHNWLFSS